MKAIAAMLFATSVSAVAGPVYVYSDADHTTVKEFYSDKPYDVIELPGLARYTPRGVYSTSDPDRIYSPTDSDRGLALLIDEPDEPLSITYIGKPIDISNLSLFETPYKLDASLDIDTITLSGNQFASFIRPGDYTSAYQQNVPSPNELPEPGGLLFLGLAAIYLARHSFA